MIEFLNMGGYGLYVWPAYLIVAIVLILNVVIPLRRHRRLLNEISRNKNPNGSDAP
ncbi:MAG: heme exporter protein CcmD [Arenicellales bacterium]|jgi:heme exporter protein D|nr:heme exporter protein CcmD [Arenicellales bacterium]MDP6411300.1 heme exporter protein CcmD [Arenicellales bacterium]MDP7452533.1 heme exporter protein CcmD [Arenicellales bacterium]MDP7618476.1 heme exporter protein CcmD [Arenicellales bacterium]|tara:strand:+ start:1986 stop:2153 length:168 start_codon:yes stop_codon:yes gene_type:complete